MFRKLPNKIGESFQTKKVFEKFTEMSEVLTSAYVWRRNDRIIASNFTLASQSHDWSTFVNYFYCLNGTVAKIEFEHKTFCGNFVVLQNIYFDKKGLILKKAIKFLNLYTNIRKTIDIKMIAKRYLAIDFYKKTNNLPFAFLLGKK